MNGCACLADGPQNPDVINERYIGCDKTSGRFADVTRGIHAVWSLGCRADRPNSGRNDDARNRGTIPGSGRPLHCWGLLLRPCRAQGSRPVSLGDLNPDGLPQRPDYAASVRRTHHVLFGHLRHPLDQRRKSRAHLGGREMSATPMAGKDPLKGMGEQPA